MQKKMLKIKNTNWRIIWVDKTLGRTLIRQLCVVHIPDGLRRPSILVFVHYSKKCILWKKLPLMIYYVPPQQQRDVTQMRFRTWCGLEINVTKRSKNVYLIGVLFHEKKVNFPSFFRYQKCIEGANEAMNGEIIQHSSVERILDALCDGMNMVS